MWLTALVALAAVAQEKPDPMELVDTEHTFAEAAATEGTNHAFLTFLADDGIIYRPGPVNGKEYLADKPETGSRLTWEPEYAEITSLGDMGWTTGPWEWHKTPSEPPSLFGQYVSVWKRQLDGAFKLVLDIGTSHPAPGREVDDLGLTVLDQVFPETPSPADLAQEKEDLLEFDRKFAKAAEKIGVRHAFQNVAAEDILLLRENLYRMIGFDEIDEHLAQFTGAYNRNPEGAGIAQTGELGYTYGRGKILPPGVDPSDYEPFAYASIWRMVDKGHWELAVDVMVQVPRSEGE